MGIDDAQARLQEIENAVASGDYKPGAWQQLLVEIDGMSVAEKWLLSNRLSEVSRVMHRRNGFPELPFLVGLAIEVVLFLVGWFLVEANHVLLRLAGIGALALSLQPLIKVVAGLVLGVRYDYVFLWYFEPRFKMRYGTYMLLPAAERVVFHLAGSIGTPLAMFIGSVKLLPFNILMAWVCFIGGLAALALQIAAFAAEWMGVRRVYGYRISTLTSPATAAYEWQKLRRAG